jgi:hypothetical protein
MNRFKFRDDVVTQWQNVWKQLCTMAYTRENITDQLLIIPQSSNENTFYERNTCPNNEEITLDYTWKEFSKKYHDALVVPELKMIFVPRVLFECLGVYSWFKFSFPNCTIMFWDNPV